MLSWTKLLFINQTHQEKEIQLRVINKAEDFLEFSKSRPAPHHIFSVIFHFNKTKRKRSKLPISKIFSPTPINVLVLMMLRLGIFVSLYFKDALKVLTCYSFLSNTDCTCLELFLQHIFSTPSYSVLAAR